MEDNYKRLEDICKEELAKRGLEHLADRLSGELREVLAQAESDYLMELYEQKAKFARNEHNLLVVYLLGLVDDFDETKDWSYIQGEMPDIDIDYLPEVRDYLKNVWALKEFGEENVCSIGTYGTLGIKMALKDVTRVYGIPRDEIDLICKGIPDKDDDGKELDWDKAQDLCPDLKNYCSRYPDIAEAVKILLDRRKSGGVHAGGLIISSKPIADFVPLEVRSVKKENKYGVVASAWSEGLRSSDLGAVGLVKFDLLVVEGLHQIAVACQLIKERHGIDRVCAKPGQRNWSDTSYLNDKKALALADNGDTKCIFQFGSQGIRRMIKEGGVSGFNDIAAYSALYRPGPMGMGMHDRYCKRKRKLEEYSLHPALRPILGSTYGVMVFQEQVLKILNVVGGIPDMHCEKLRKAISKKKIAQFAKSKEQFIKNGQIVLGVSEEYVTDLWNQVEAFADYGFNKSMLIDTLIPTPYGVKRLGDFHCGDIVYGVDAHGNTVEVPVVAVHDHGVLEGYEVTFDDGSTEVCSQDHKFLTPFGQMPLWEICGTQSPVYCDQKYKDMIHCKSEEGRLDDSLRVNSFPHQVEATLGRIPDTGCLVEAGSAGTWEYHAPTVEHGMFQEFVGGDEARVVPATPGHAGIADTRHLVLRKIVRVVPVGKRRMCDLEVASSTHNFLLTNGVVTSNSHSYAYSFISARQLWLMAHYPLEFYCAMLMCEKDVVKIKEIKIDASLHGIELAPLHINKSKANFSIQKDDDGGVDKIFYGFSNLQKIGEKVADRAIAEQPYSSFEDFLQKFGTDSAVIKAVVSLNAFRVDDRLRLYKFAEHWKDYHKKRDASKERFEDALVRYEGELQTMLESYKEHVTNPADYVKMGSFTEEAYELWEKYFCDIEEEEPYNYKGEVRTRTITALKRFQNIRRKRDNSISGRATKEQDAIKDGEPTYATFEPHRCKVKVDPEDEALLVGDTRKAEKLYYGFEWVSIIEESPDYHKEWNETTDEVLASGVSEGCIAVRLNEVKRVATKKGDNFYYVLFVEDANGRTAEVTMWEDDHKLFEEQLVPGNLMRMHVIPPDRFTRWSFKSVPRHLRRNLRPETDHRLCLMRPPVPKGQKSDAAILLEGRDGH